MAHIFETKSCGRCGGSGTYSYNAMHGNRCYGCGGTGVVLSKRGIAARAFYLKSMTRKLSEIKVGDYVMFDNSMWGGPKRWWKVEEIVASTVKYIVKDEKDKTERFRLTLSRKGNKSSFDGLSLDYEFECVSSDEELAAKKQAALEYQATLDEKGKQPKTKQKSQQLQAA